ncbi:hypothetical protein KIN20_006742 [Parelaphostrongylus tenuis]|uniref:Uncharacterized protein n=1 Tax=Parelaphostrongylus tenuis TaxID=148309 RepID=A0AAD5QH51_PARTN|nr:hypothetical protein KIN20_006742 [Parelaphostrongylus tenuis]
MRKIHKIFTSLWDFKLDYCTPYLTVSDVVKPVDAAAFTGKVETGSTTNAKDFQVIEKNRAI